MLCVGEKLDEGGFEMIQTKIEQTDNMIRHYESMLRLRDHVTSTTHPTTVST